MVIKFYEVQDWWWPHWRDDVWLNNHDLYEPYHEWNSLIWTMITCATWLPGFAGTWYGTM